MPYLVSEILVINGCRAELYVHYLSQFIIAVVYALQAIFFKYANVDHIKSKQISYLTRWYIVIEIKLKCEGVPILCTNTDCIV